MNDMTKIAEPVTAVEPNRDNLSTAPLDGATAPPKFETEKVFPLSAPVKRMNGQMLDSITLRAPVGLDMFEIGGMPTKTSWAPGGMIVEMDTDRLQQYLTRLSGLEKPVLYQIPARNIRAMFEWLNTELNASGN